jgi:hypothetical protein
MKDMGVTSNDLVSVKSPGNAVGRRRANSDPSDEGNDDAFVSVLSHASDPQEVALGLQLRDARELDPQLSSLRGRELLELA